VVGLALDVTKQKQAEEQLLNQQHLMEEMLHSHERDRRLVAYEIHDGPVQLATGAAMHLDAVLQAGQIPAGQPRDELEVASGLVRDAINEARRLISGLRPPILDELGVVAAIEHLIRGRPAGGPSIECTVQVRFDRLEPLLEGTIYRIVQEAVANVTQHSKSDRAEIRLVQSDDRIHLEIRDWGVGFDPARIEGKRFGLRGIRERARLLRGRAIIDSVPGKGSRVFVDLPVAGVPKEVAITNERSIE
jgi:signal transduction histidine kinase